MKDKKSILTAIVSVLLSVTLVAVAVSARTTVGNDITVASNLTVTATTTLTGNLIAGSRVGIGAASPATLLEISDSDASPILTITNASTTTDYDPTLALRKGATDYWKLYLDDSDSDKLKIATSTADVLAIDQSGNVGIGTTTPSERLHLHGGTILQSPTNPVLVGGVDLGGGGGGCSANNEQVFAVAVAGKYAYLGLGTGCGGGVSGTEFRIYDTSTSTPSLVGELELDSEVHDIYIAGKYAYIAKTGWGTVSTKEFLVIDISNPSSPSVVGGVDTPYDWALEVQVSGNYAYITNGGINGSTCPSQCELHIVDISNPASPSIVGSGDATNGAWVWGLYVQGKYAYVATDDGAATPGLLIFDISDPGSPVLEASLGTGSFGVLGVYVSGRYAYLACSDNNLRIYDISTSTSPILMSTLSGVSGGGHIYVSGRYAYARGSSSNQDVVVIDVKDPSSPSIVGAIDLGTFALRDIYVSGRYAFVTDKETTAAGRKFAILDISGVETASGLVHSLETGNLQVRDGAVVGGRLSVAGAIGVGGGGIFNAGPLVAVASSSQTILNVTQQGTGPLFNTTNSALSTSDAFTITNLGSGKTFAVNDEASDTTPFVIDASGNLGIGTATPQSKLQVNGYIQMNTNNGAPAAGDCDADAERGRMILDYSNNRLYICNGAARGWDYIDLTD